MKNKKIFFAGIGGISMSALAFFALNFGGEVCGSDVCENEQTRKLENAGAKIFVGHNKEHVTKDLDCFVFSSAIKEDNEEFVRAKELNIPIFSRAEFLQCVAGCFENVIAVAGTHGKTTSTAMLFEVFKQANLLPTLHLGGVLKKDKTNFVLGDKQYFITEACEYEKNFLKLAPNFAIITNVDYDHVDTYPSKKEYDNAFVNFASKCDNVFCFEDFNVEKNAKLHGKMCKISKKSIKNIKNWKNGQFSFDFEFNGKVYKNIQVGAFGEFNVFNATLVFALCVTLGISPRDIKIALKNFEGTERRFEYMGLFNGAQVYIDYAHHPKEIEEVLKLCRCFTNGKIFCAFQFHTYTRTQVFWEQFLNCFCGVSKLLLFPVYSAREEKKENIDAEHFSKELKSCECVLINSFDEGMLNLKSCVKKGDFVVVLGAGNVCEFANFLVKGGKNG